MTLYDLYDFLRRKTIIVDPAFLLPGLCLLQTCHIGCKRHDQHSKGATVMHLWCTVKWFLHMTDLNDRTVPIVVHFASTTLQQLPVVALTVSHRAIRLICSQSVQNVFLQPPHVPLSIAHFSLRFFCAFGLNGWRSLALTCIKGSPYNFPNRQFVLEFWARTPNLLSESWARTSEGY